MSQKYTITYKHLRCNKVSLPTAQQSKHAIRPRHTRWVLIGYTDLASWRDLAHAQSSLSRQCSIKWTGIKRPFAEKKMSPRRVNRNILVTQGLAIYSFISRLRTYENLFKIIKSWSYWNVSNQHWFIWSIFTTTTLRQQELWKFMQSRIKFLVSRQQSTPVTMMQIFSSLSNNNYM